MMTDAMAQALLLSSLAAAAIPVGGLLARIESLYPAWQNDEAHHGVIAFGAGALLSAVALVLVPKGVQGVSEVWAVALFVAGGVGFALLDAALARSGGGLGQLLAMLSDFLPECIALGALLASGAPEAILLALMIGLQNLPEGFNAYREITQTRHASAGRVLLIFAGLALLGPLAALFGMLVLAGEGGTLGGIMLFAAGGILYVIFQDIAPQVRLERRALPPMGAVLGFAFGLTGHVALL